MYFFLLLKWRWWWWKEMWICVYVWIPDDFLTHEKKRILCMKIIIKEKKISLSFATSHRFFSHLLFIPLSFFSLRRFFFLFCVNSKAELQYEFFILIKWIKLLFSSLLHFFFIPPLPCSYVSIYLYNSSRDRVWSVRHS